LENVFQIQDGQLPKPKSYEANAIEGACKHHDLVSVVFSGLLTKL